MVLGTEREKSFFCILECSRTGYFRASSLPKARPPKWWIGYSP